MSDDNYMDAFESSWEGDGKNPEDHYEAPPASSAANGRSNREEAYNPYP